MTAVLHACCGPCASACVPRLREAGADVTLLFANSNVDTAEEFERRRAAAEALARAEGVLFAALPYDHAAWRREVAAGYEDAPEKGARCARCFRYSLTQAAAFAAANGLDAFTTSLTVSPHKVSAVVFAAGEAAAEEAAANEAAGKTTAGEAADAAGDAAADTADAAPPRFLAIDFKKREGFKLSVRRAAELGLYRQAYCGCEFSRRKERT